jgi:hypothetical protein
MDGTVDNPPRSGVSSVGDAPYRRVPAYLIRRIQLISTSMIAEAFEGENMSLSEWAVLTIIENHPDIDQSRLAEIVSIDRVNTGRLSTNSNQKVWSRGALTKRTAGIGDYVVRAEDFKPASSYCLGHWRAKTNCLRVCGQQTAKSSLNSCSRS